MGQACDVLIHQGNFKIPGLSEDRFDKKFEQGKQLAPKVCQAKNRVTSIVCVAYRLSKENCPCKDGEKLSQHIKTLLSFDHPHGCRLLEAFDAGRSAVLVYTSIDGKKLMESLGRDRHLTEKKVATLMAGVVKALHAGASKGIVHGALCPKNFFLITHDKQQKLVITDMGLAGNLKPMPITNCNSSDVMAHLPPEAVKRWVETQKFFGASAGRSYLKSTRKTLFEADSVSEKDKADLMADLLQTTITTAADVWSLGTILAALLTGEQAFRGKDLPTLCANIEKKDVVFPQRAKASDAAKELIKKMLNKDPKQRPTLDDLINDPWFQEEGGTASTEAIDEKLVEQLGSIHAETHFKKVMMRIISSKVPGRKIKDLQAAFEALDSDGDGQITLKEFKEGIQKSELFGGMEDVESAFSEIDYNHSGSISVKEFLAATIDSQEEVVESVLWDAFRAVDVDGDNKLDLQELERVVKSLDSALGGDHVEMMMHLLEHEVTGPISFNEFKELIFNEGGRTTDVVELKQDGLPFCAKARRQVRQVIDARPCRQVEKAEEEVPDKDAKSKGKAKGKTKAKAKPKPR
eukprot:TRINITY_DN40021_c0_g1_i1.p1 TRINITY_DN40021_c0_g1~~TRINITY_DN40021_c0_g1_i1.p1  ORF type:complete len:577 (+),score=180.90 TRINITY_DN40021_c0_g1_i1:118-1848(+)